MPVSRDEVGYGIGLQILIHVGQQEVFDAITNPEKIKIWDYPDNVDVDLRVKGWIRLQSGGVEREGRIILVNPPAAFAYKIPTPYPAHERNKIFAATVHYVLDDMFGQTRVRLRHSEFPKKQFAEVEERAWKGIYLPRLKEYCEGKDD